MNASASATGCANSNGGNARNAQSWSAMNAGAGVVEEGNHSPPSIERTLMRRRSGLASLIIGVAIFVSGFWASGSVATAGGGNPCTDHCADRYKVAKDACRLIPFKTERKICDFVSIGAVI